MRVGAYRTAPSNIILHIEIIPKTRGQRGAGSTDVATSGACDRSGDVAGGSGWATGVDPQDCGGRDGYFGQRVGSKTISPRSIGYAEESLAES